MAGYPDSRGRCEFAGQGGPVGIPPPTATVLRGPMQPGPTTYAQLSHQVRAAGLLTPNPWFYFLNLAFALGALSLSLLFLTVMPVWWAAVIAGLGFGLASSQIGLMGHDVGHIQFIRRKLPNQLAGMFLGNILLGFSRHWWVSKHNLHHATPNSVGEDPDVEFSLLVFSPDQMGSRAAWAKPLVRRQGFLIFVYMPLQAMNARLGSMRHVLATRPRLWRLEVATILVHFALYLSIPLLLGVGWLPFLIFALVHQAVFGICNVLIFAPNHKGMPMVPEGEHWGFLKTQIVTARNVRSPLAIAWFFGGLNYQIEHHLFPTMPRHNLRKARPYVKALCAAARLPYVEEGVVASYRGSFGHLTNVTREIETLSRAEALRLKTLKSS